MMKRVSAAGVDLEVRIRAERPRNTLTKGKRLWWFRFVKPPGGLIRSFDPDRKGINFGSPILSKSNWLAATGFDGCGV